MRIPDPKTVEGMIMAAIPLTDILNSKVNQEKQEMKASTLQDAMNGNVPSGMKFHIEINATSSEGNDMKIVADVTNQEDLAKIHQMYERYMPRTGFLQKLLGV
ncbi:MAG: hypothetical protein M0Q91_17385 [Methanoregula sp.]|jgi:hypothetical protein|nr:hypothetical protein [Methanoregula sp.]